METILDDRFSGIQSLHDLTIKEAMSSGNVIFTPEDTQDLINSFKSLEDSIITFEGDPASERELIKQSIKNIEALLIKNLNKSKPVK